MEIKINAHQRRMCGLIEREVTTYARQCRYPIIEQKGYWV